MNIDYKLETVSSRFEDKSASEPIGIRKFASSTIEDLIYESFNSTIDTTEFPYNLLDNEY